MQSRCPRSPLPWSASWVLGQLVCIMARSRWDCGSRTRQHVCAWQIPHWNPVRRTTPCKPMEFTGTAVFQKSHSGSKGRRINQNLDKWTCTSYTVQTWRSGCWTRRQSPWFSLDTTRAGSHVIQRWVARQQDWPSAPSVTPARLP